MNLLTKISIVLMLFGTTFFSATRCRAAAAAVGGVEVNVLPLPSLVGSGRNPLVHGRIEYRAQIKNNAKEDRVVHLQIPAPAAYRPDTGTIVARTVSIAAGQEAIVSLFQFPGRYEGTMEVRVDGVSEKEVIGAGAIAPAYYGGGWRGESPATPAVLMSRSISVGFYDSPRTATAADPSSSPGYAAPEPDFNFFHSELPITQWSPNWLGYSCFDVVLLTAKDVEQMPPEVRLAMRRYLECGGTILVHGQKVPLVFSENSVNNGKGGYYVGRGHAVASGAKNEANWGAAARSLAGLRSMLSPHYASAKPNNPHNLLVAQSQVPVRGMFVLVLLFAVGIGPANLWLLTRYKRRIWLWWDVPAISLVTCLAVFGYSVLSEGWRGHGKTASMTLLDQRTHRATTFGYASYYCPLTPSSGPRFGADTDVTMSDEQSSPYGSDPYGRGRAEIDARYVDFSSDQHLAGGWVRARVPAYFPFCKNEDRRERLNFAKKGNVPSVVNALGADIDRLYWADASGKVFAGRDIAAGAEKTLAASAQSVASTEAVRTDYERLIGSGTTGALGFFDHCQSDADAARWLLPGAYIAVLKKSPFVEASLAGTPSEDTAAIVYGICEEQTSGR